MMFRLDPTLGSAILAAGSLLFASAGVHKLFDATFGAALRRYELLPDSLVAPTARALPIIEITIACALLFSFTRTFAASAGAALIFVYAVVIGINLRRGRLELDCGCFGFGRQRQIGSWMVWRNCAIAIMLLVTLSPWSERPWHWVDTLTISGAAAILALLYLALDTLWTRPAASMSRPKESTP